MNDPTEEELIVLGRRYLAEQQLRTWAEVWRGALDEAAAAEVKIREHLLKMREDGTFKESAAAEIVGVSPMKIRGWFRVKPTEGSTEVPVETSLLS